MTKVTLVLLAPLHTRQFLVRAYGVYVSRCVTAAVGVRRHARVETRDRMGSPASELDLHTEARAGVTS